jgi:hypothetical protein
VTVKKEDGEATPPRINWCPKNLAASTMAQPLHDLARDYLR